MKLIKCANCKKENFHHAKGLCYSCYKKQWKPKKITCKNCNKKKDHKAFNLCESCHMKLYHYDKIKKYQKKREKCVSCGFKKILQPYFIEDLEHIMLCPNCKSMIESVDHRTIIIKKLEEKGYDFGKA